MTFAWDRHKHVKESNRERHRHVEESNRDRHKHVEESNRDRHKHVEKSNRLMGLRQVQTCRRIKPVNGTPILTILII
jgi:hypothetical protein